MITNPTVYLHVLINPCLSRHIPVPSVRESCIATCGVGVWYYKIKCTCIQHFGNPIPSDILSDTILLASLKQKRTPLQNCRKEHMLSKKSV